MRRRRSRRPKPKPKVVQTFRANEKIIAPTVFLIGAEGEPVGEIATEKALEMAREAELDLIEVSPQAKPPVCKLLDYGKFQYAQSKKEQQNKSHQKKVDIKGVRIGLRVDKHDLLFKRDQAEKFLGKGHKVKIELLLRGREKAMRDRAREAMKEFLAMISIPYKVEEDIKNIRNGINMIIAPE
jgi:translation initiation factor IF-3